MAGEADRRWVDSMPDAYERALVPAVFRPFAVDLAKRIAARSPKRVLELAAGTGVLARELVAALGGAEVTATDLNQAMVDHGQALAPGATWRQADAMQLPFADRQFDVLACQFGAMFFPDKTKAFAEARRVLTEDGAFFVSAWGPLDEHDYQATLVAVLEDLFPDDPPTFMVSVPHAYADVGAVTADLAAGGFCCSQVETIVLEGRAPSAAEIAIGYCTGTPLRAGLEARGDVETLTSRVASGMEERMGPGPVVGRMAAHVVEAIPA